MDPEAPREDRDRLGVLAPALRAIARRYGTPVYVTDIAALETAAEAVSAAFPDPWERRYSLKANDLPALVARLAGLGFGANVVSRGEWALATRAGIPNADDHARGDRQDGRRPAGGRPGCRGGRAAALGRAGVGGGGRRPGAAVGAVRAVGGVDGALRVDVLLRLNPEVEPETHRSLATGAAVSKFGLTADEVSGRDRGRRRAGRTAPVPRPPPPRRVAAGGCRRLARCGPQGAGAPGAPPGRAADVRHARRRRRLPRRPAGRAGARSRSLCPRAPADPGEHPGRPATGPTRRGARAVRWWRAPAGSWRASSTSGSGLRLRACRPCWTVRDRSASRSYRARPRRRIARSVSS